jgi:hypothetical protein
MAYENFDITSANAKLWLIVNQIFQAGFALEQFGTDQAWNQDAIDITETRMGVDGKMVAGYTPAIFPVTITLEASSPSRFNLSTVWEAMKVNRQIYACTLAATIPSVGERILWTKGVLKNGAPVPSGQKILAPTTWTFHFESLERVRI